MWTIQTTGTRADLRLAQSLRGLMEAFYEIDVDIETDANPTLEGIVRLYKDESLVGSFDSVPSEDLLDLHLRLA